MDDPSGNSAETGLLGFFLEEFGPSIHKQAAQRLGAVGPGVGVRAGRQGERVWSQPLQPEKARGVAASDRLHLVCG